MALYDRLSNGVPVHAFSAGIRRWAMGSSIVTRAAIITKLNLDAADEVGLDAMAAVYAAKPTAATKQAYLMAVEDANILLEAGFYNEAQWRAEVEV